MEKILIKNSFKGSFFIAKYKGKLGRIQNSEFVPYLDDETINEKSEFESSLDWEEFDSVNQFLDGYFFDIFEDDTVKSKIQNLKGTKDVIYSNDLDGIKNRAGQLEKYWSRKIIGFSVHVFEKDKTSDVLDNNYTYEKTQFINSIESAYDNFESELKELFTFKGKSDYKYVELIAIFQNNYTQILAHDTSLKY